MLHLAALLTGFGGLVLQLAWLRRYGLLLGNTGVATAQVLGVFLLGLGVGGLLVSRWRATGAAPLRLASYAYAVVALAGVLGEPLLRVPVSLPAGWAQLTLLLVPGLPALLMGAAFPCLFAGLRRGASAFELGVLSAANLSGAVAGAFLGGNFLLPDLGLLRCGQLAGFAYLLAALMLAVRVRRLASEVISTAVTPAPTAPTLRTIERRTVLVAGVLQLGMEILWLRRLPFFLEGFQPTLSGVIAAVLLWGALGAAVLTPLLSRVCGERAVLVAGVLALLACNVGLHESLVPALSRLPVTSTAGMHWRVLLGVSAAVALPCLFLGAVVPLALVRFVHPETRGQVAGALFGLLGLGELVGALLVGHALPWLLPDAFFAIAPLALSCVALLVWRPALGNVLTGALLVVVVALSTLGISGAGSPWSPSPPARGSRHDRALDYVHLDHAVDSSLTASVAYNRRTHSLVLFTDEFRATETGPNTAYMRVLGHLPFLLRDGLERVALIALGTGTTFDALAAWPDPTRIDVVELSAAVVRVAGNFTADGPVTDGRAPGFVTDDRARLHVTDGRAFLSRCAPASLDLLTMEPLLPYAPGTTALYSAEFYALVARTLSDRGLVLQWLPTHAMPQAMFDALVSTFVQGFAHTSVWLVDHSTILVGSQLPHAPTQADLERRFAALSPALRAALHDAGLATPTDVNVALVSASPSAQRPGGSVRVLTDDAPFLERLAYWDGHTRLSFLPDNLLRLGEMAVASEQPPAWREARMRRVSGLRNLALARLAEPGAAALPRAVLDFDAARVRAPASVLLHREQGKAMRALFEHQIVQRATPDQALPVAERMLQTDAGSALALATLAAATDEPAARARRFAAALSLDPLLAFALPPALVSVDVRTDLVSPREDLGRLPADAQLAAAACGDGARAAVLRGTFPARVGRSLCVLARSRALSEEENGALLPVLDPWLFSELAAAVGARNGDLAAEVLPLWRRDLSAIAALEGVLAGPPAARQALAERLGGRGDAGARELLARLLTDASLPVRQVAAIALTRTAAGRIAYDPEGSETERAAAAAAVRRMHNPPP